MAALPHGPCTVPGLWTSRNLSITRKCFLPALECCRRGLFGLVAIASHGSLSVSGSGLTDCLVTALVDRG